MVMSDIKTLRENYMENNIYKNKDYINVDQYITE